MPACLPSAAVSLAWGVLDGDCGLVWGFLSWRGGLAGGPGDAHSGVGSPTWVFDPVAVAPPRVFSAPECSHNSWVVLRSTLSNFLR